MLILHLQQGGPLVRHCLSIRHNPKKLHSTCGILTFNLDANSPFRICTKKHEYHDLCSIHGIFIEDFCCKPLKKEPWQKQENLLKSLGSGCVQLPWSLLPNGASWRCGHPPCPQRRQRLGWWPWECDSVFFFRQALKKLKGGILVVAFLLKVFCWWSIHIYSFLEIWRNLKKYIYICVLNFTQTCDMVWRNPSDDFFSQMLYLGWCFSGHHM